MRRHRVPLRTPDEGKAEVGDSRASLDDQVDHQASHHGYENRARLPRGKRGRPCWVPLGEGGLAQRYRQR